MDFLGTGEVLATHTQKLVGLYGFFRLSQQLYPLALTHCISQRKLVTEVAIPLWGGARSSMGELFLMVAHSSLRGAL
jgi:hypothetical protein